MRPLNIEFRSTKTLLHRLTPWICAACLCVVVAQVIVTIGMHHDLRLLAQESSEAQAKIDDLRLVNDKSKIPVEYADAAALAFRVASFPLEFVTSPLENANVQSVQLTSVDINAGTKSAKAEVESISAESIEKFLAQLAVQEQTPKWKVLAIQESAVVPLPSGSPGPLPPGLLSNRINIIEKSSNTSGSYTASVQWKD